jgi:mono/diheme cytochrome c family protein
VNLTSALLALVVAADPGGPLPPSKPREPPPQPSTFDALMALPPQFDGMRAIPLPPNLPRRALRLDAPHPDKKYVQDRPWGVLLGEMLFHSTRLLGPRTMQMGVSCNSCHPNGSTSPTIFNEHSLMVPGRIDLTVGYFTPAAENGISDPHVIPTLRGIRQTAPYQVDGKVPSLREQIRHVVVNEFGTAEPPPLYLDAMTSFLVQLDFLPNSKLNPDGTLSAAASATARRGEKAFNKQRPELGGRSCASCHVPEDDFTDRKSHRLGLQEGRYDTPTLMGLVATPPYWHDARARTIEDALAEVERLFGLKLPADERAELVAYLKEIGAENEPWEPPSLARRAAPLLAFYDLALEGPWKDDGHLWKLALETATFELDDLGFKSSKTAAVKKAFGELEAAANAAVAKAPNDADRKAVKAARAALQKALQGL